MITRIKCGLFSFMLLIAINVLALEAKLNHYFYQPVFEINREKYHSGKGFFVTLENKNYFITAHHIFGPAGGHQKDFKWTEMNNVKNLVVLNLFNDKEITVGPGIKIEGAAGAFNENYSDDVAVFHAPEFKQTTSPLARDLPKVGAEVWLYSTSKTDGVLHRAKVLESSDRRLVYQYIDSDFKMQATSGAPVLNSDGEVVAINILGGVTNEKAIGIGNPVTAFLPRVQKAIKDE